MKLLVYLSPGRLLGHGEEHGELHGEEHGELRDEEHGEVCEPGEQVWLERILHVPAQGRQRLPRISRRQ